MTQSKLISIVAMWSKINELSVTGINKYSEIGIVSAAKMESRIQ